MESKLEVRILICSDCNEEFAFTVEAQEYFAERGYVDDPLMCKFCYTRSKRDKRSGGASSGSSNGSKPRKKEVQSADRAVDKNFNR